jgi:hypothetical protein
LLEPCCLSPSSSPSHFASETSSRGSSDAGPMIVHLQYCFLDVVRLPSGDARYASRLLVTVRVRPVATHVTRAVCSSQSAFAQWRRTLRELSARHSPRSPSGDARLRELSARHSPRSPSGDARLRELSARHSPRSPGGDARDASCLLVTVRVCPVATHVLRELVARHCPRPPSATHACSSLVVSVRSPVQSAFIRSHAFSAS